jgi:hypothetical protein
LKTNFLLVLKYILSNGSEITWKVGSGSGKNLFGSDTLPLGPHPSGHPSPEAPSPRNAYPFQLSQRLTSPIRRCHTDFSIRDVAINIDAQETLATATYNQLVQLAALELPINAADFVRMWKTLILKRVLDVYESEKRLCANHLKEISRNMRLPAPLADLLYSLGSFFDPSSGTVLRIRFRWD